MIADELKNLSLYEKVHPLFSQIIRFLETHNLDALPSGRTQIGDAGCFVNIEETKPKSVAQARLETHRRMIDIQVPLSDDERMGYRRTATLAQADYNSEKDICFHEEIPDTYLKVDKGTFVVFFPQDAHAPGISEQGLRKAVFKIPL